MIIHVNICVRTHCNTMFGVWVGTYHTEKYAQLYSNYTFCSRYIAYRNRRYLSKFSHNFFYFWLGPKIMFNIIYIKSAKILSNRKPQIHKSILQKLGLPFSVLRSAALAILIFQASIHFPNVSTENYCHKSVDYSSDFLLHNDAYNLQTKPINAEIETPYS